ncbi:MAG TPA: quinolinate synthase NadA [Deltaproteobacteria bacterium]|nr:quinolinate synthase NadA [Deltaproteobacteria bacterium]
MKDNQSRDLIKRIKKEFGERLVILGHHYQSDDVLEYADYVGDSLELARKASTIQTADILVFCGVYFMAETAAILAPDKAVYIPDVGAGCPLADMAKIEDVERAWDSIMQCTSSVTPVTYVNSSAQIKAFCGSHGGTVCTSGNAHKVFDWAFQQSDKVFFMPDRNLGRNTARSMNIPDDEMVEWDPDREDGGLDEAAIANSRVILWKGWCPVHWPNFSKDAVEKIRREFPGAKIIVHPESDPATVEASDESGSTAQILEYVKALEPGERVVIGTEFNMVSRVAQDYQSVVDVMPLSRELCEDMGKITLDKLAQTLAGLDADTYRVKVDEDIARDAFVALENMLRI